MSNPQPLAKLIRDRMLELGLTYRDVEKRSEQGGYRISHATANNLATGKRHRLIGEKTLRGLSIALDLPFNVLAAASAEQAGYNLLDDVPTTLRSAATLQKVVEVHQELPAEQQITYASIAEQIAALTPAQREEWFAKMAGYVAETAAQAKAKGKKRNGA